MAPNSPTPDETTNATLRFAKAAGTILIGALGLVMTAAATAPVFQPWACTNFHVWCLGGEAAPTETRPTIVTLLEAYVVAGGEEPAITEAPQTSWVRPVQLLNDLTPELLDHYYPEEARQSGREGNAHLLCIVTGDDFVCRLEPDVADNAVFGEAALQLARYLEFAPRLRDGIPEPCEAKLAIAFELRH